MTPPWPYRSSFAASPRARSICARIFSQQLSGKTVIRSFAPLPSRTAKQRRSRSISLMRRRSASEIRKPEPYRRLTTRSYGGDSRARMLRTSGRLSTTGTRTGRFARTTSSSQGSSISSTSRYKNRIPLSAWFWVAAATCRRTARSVRKASISRLPISHGCRLPWNRMNRFAHCTYACSVR